MSLGLLLSAAEGGDATPASAAPPDRTTHGLQVLYEFSHADGPLVEDTAGVDPPLHLRIADPERVRFTDEGVEIVRETLLRTNDPATRLINAIRQSSALSVEVWMRPARLNQEGPARIVTLSRDASRRNVTLGQENDRIDVRLRTRRTSQNGIPSVQSPDRSLRPAPTHVLYTRDADGIARIYINGRLRIEEMIGGDLSNWDSATPLALANELSGDRPWLGTLRLVAIYNRALSADEVEQNYRVTVGKVADNVAASPAARNARMFQMKVAPLLAQHCLECHDTATHNGGLDLSRKDSALAGGETGKAFVAGDVEESLLWQLVEIDAMPHDRPPLSAEQKSILRDWLDGGAEWSLDFVDPAVYQHGSGTQRRFVQRLTVPEYVETVRATLGVDIAEEAVELLPADLRADGFSNTAYNLNVDLAHVKAYARLAELIVDRVDVGKLAREHTKSRELTDENITKIIKPWGLRLLRSPLSDDDILKYCGISTTVAGAGGDFEAALGYILEAMLQSPRFLYRVENQRGDGAAWPADGFEIAARMSYIIWGGPPDQPLLKAANEGKLSGPAIEKQVRRMLRDPRAVARSRQFVAEWLNLDQLENLRPNPEKFPNWNPELAGDMRAETLAYFEEIVWTENRPLADLLDVQVTFVTPRLAEHYGLPPVDIQQQDGLVRYDLSSIPERGGLLTQGSVLTVGGDEASTVTRGLFVLHELLRGVVKDPPPCVDTTPMPTQAGTSQRAIAEVRIADAKCAGCHVKFEPLSFGLGKFDGLGSYREHDDHGNQLRDDGEILIPGQAETVSYDSSAELMALLAASPRVAETFTWKLTQFCLGRPLGAADAPILAEIHRASQEEGGTYQSLIKAIVKSDLVQMTRTEPRD